MSKRIYIKYAQSPALILGYDNSKLQLPSFTLPLINSLGSWVCVAAQTIQDTYSFAQV